MKGNTHICCRYPKPDTEATPPMLVNEISKLFRDLMRASEADGNTLSHGARMMIMLLSEEDGQTQQKLATSTHMSAPSVSAAVDRLCDAGYTARIRDEKDGRSVRVHLTEKGIERNCAVRENLSRFDAVMMAGISDRDAEALRRLLLRMRDNILAEAQKNNAQAY